MKLLQENWREGATVVEGYSKLMPDPSLCDIFTNEIKVLFLDKDDTTLALAKEQAAHHSCLKHPTGAVLVSGNTVLGEGGNAGVRRDYCPRLVENCKTGEGYHHCRDFCKQTEHAEVSAVLDATNTLSADVREKVMAAVKESNRALINKDKEGYLAGLKKRNDLVRAAFIEAGMENLDLVLYGHWWCCRSCTETMQAAGVKRVFLMEDAYNAFNPDNGGYLLPKLDSKSGRLL